MDKRPLLVTSVLAAVIALAGCGNGAVDAAGTAGPTPSASATTPAPSVTASATATPSSTTTPVPGAVWSGETAYAACIAFHREKTAADGFDPDASTWNAYSPEVARRSGDQWTVDLIGTVKGEDGATYDGVFSCLVGGTPAAPEVSEFTGG
jgi:hypothetical protein